MKTPSGCDCQPTVSSSRWRSACRPSPVSADSFSPAGASGVSGVPAASAAPDLAAAGTLSDLFQTSITGTDFESFWARALAIRASPAMYSIALMRVKSCRNSTASALSIWPQARAIPICSTSSLLSRRPAVSTTCSGTPSICMVWDTTSRVVPATGVTMASSAPASALSSELFPALGCPAITTLMPSRSSAPWRACWNRLASICCRFDSCPCASALRRKSISSSGKSSVASTSMRRWIRLSRRRCTSPENAPASERLALRAAASVLASIRSATASACARSILSFRKARSVNSPGRASRSPRLSPASRQRARSSCSTTGPPWACSSSTSSPV